MEIVKRSISASRRLLGNLWKFFVGGVIVAVGFLGNFIDLKQPDLSIEITEIQQRTSADIDVKSSPFFAKLRELMSGDIEFRFNSPFRDADPFKALQLAIDRRAQEIADSERNLNGMRATAEKIPRDFKPNISEDERKERTQLNLIARNDEDVKEV